mgnify:CR=1 FL=1
MDLVTQITVPSPHNNFNFYEKKQEAAVKQAFNNAISKGLPDN